MGWSQRTTTLNVCNVSFSDHDLLMRKAGIANGSCKFDSQQVERFFLRLDDRVKLFRLLNVRSTKMFMFMDSIHAIEGWIESMNMNKV